jgi:nucleotide-binding universal stress UspA family protein
VTSQLAAYDRERSATAASAASAPVPGGSPVSVENGCRRLTIRHVLVPLDGSSVAECTLAFASAIAQPFSARVTILRVLESVDSQPIDAVEWEMARAEAYARLVQLADTLKGHGLTAAVEIVQGRPAEQIPHFAATHDADLIVLSTHGAGGLNQWSLGGTVQKVIATTHASVLIVPARWPASDSVRLQRMLVPLDCSPRAECILPAATELARAHGAQLILAHVVAEPEMPRRLPPSSEDLNLIERITQRNHGEARRYLLDIQQRLSASAGSIEVQIVVSPRRIQALRNLAREHQVDLIILSAHGSTGDAKEHYGAVASRFLQDGGEPVIILQDLAAAVARGWEATDTVWQERPAH